MCMSIAIRICSSMKSYRDTAPTQYMGWCHTHAHAWKQHIRTRYVFVRASIAAQRGQRRQTARRYGGVQKQRQIQRATRGRPRTNTCTTTVKPSLHQRVVSSPHPSLRLYMYTYTIRECKRILWSCVSRCFCTYMYTYAYAEEYSRAFAYHMCI